jgi:hypothetical protein
VEEYLTSTDNWAGERHNGGYCGKAIYSIEHTGGDAVKLSKSVIVMMWR